MMENPRLQILTVKKEQSKYDSDLIRVGCSGCKMILGHTKGYWDKNAMATLPL